jgi:hypothetical protein
MDGSYVVVITWTHQGRKFTPEVRVSGLSDINIRYESPTSSCSSSSLSMLPLMTAQSMDLPLDTNLVRPSLLSEFLTEQRATPSFPSPSVALGSPHRSGPLDWTAEQERAEADYFAARRRCPPS